jgi:hypothetical protein
MDATNPILADPVELIRQLDPDVIRNRIEELDRERDALLVLLRSAQRKKPDSRAKPPRTKEATVAVSS